MILPSPGNTVGRGGAGDIGHTTPKTGRQPQLLVAASQFDGKNWGPLPARLVRDPVGLCCGVRSPQVRPRPQYGRVAEGRIVTFGFAPSSAASMAASSDLSATSANPLARMLEPAEWAAAGIPLLRNPREVVSGLHARHWPRPSTAVVAVLDPDERLRASASFTRRPAAADGWVFRNALLAQLRRVIPHDLRRRTPVRTAVLLYCREGDARWTEEDGAWMWGLRDACTLHGLRCGAYITLTRDGWQVIGEDRGGRHPNAVSAPEAFDLAGAPTSPQPRTGGVSSDVLRRAAAR